ncbi:YgiQ family radical SAM protein [Methylophilus sp.]|uniref:YgiQ family radical SAM protein n=1 Tax=Methylophilus sp. TaxID=29541 RepID=UPI000D4433D0|nr:YgiQ family radical SAM protein [Methylophilus sp.]PPD12483.1 MAG: YgiQ family radical SAM protein [Methylophilus sp.]
MEIYTSLTAKPVNSYRPYWAKRFGTAPVLPMSRAEMDALGWDSCDIILVSGDAYIDHPSFGVALIGRLLEAQGFRVGIIAQPDWQSAEPFKVLGKPNLYFGVTAGNMDSMVNRYTADRKIRSDDAYTPNAEANKRPDRAVLVYSQRCKEAYSDVPLVIGSIEASLRRIAHYDYWSDKVRRSILIDSKADLLVYGNAERAIVELSHRIARGEAIHDIQDIRGTAFIRKQVPDDFVEVPSTRLDRPGVVEKHEDPYAMKMGKGDASCATDEKAGETAPTISLPLPLKAAKVPRDRQVIRMPSYEEVVNDPVMYAHASRVLHLEANPGNARALVQKHGNREVWLNPPPIPLTTKEMDYVYDLPYARKPHPAYKGANIPAWEMIRFSVNIMRGCFGGCTFCSITEHEGRIIQSRSEDSILREIEEIRDKVDGFTGVISDLGGPTANMYRLSCKSEDIEKNCRKLSCVYPGVCENLNTDHSALIQLYRKARSLRGVKKILIGSGLRYDLAVKSPEYVKELVQHHVGGYLKIAPEHSEENVLSKMMKPGMGAYDEFKRMFEKFSAEAGKKQYLIPYFIAAHPGTTDEDMLNLALWLKRNDFRLDQVQTFTPTPMAMATAMYHSGKNPLRKVTADSEPVPIPKTGTIRKLHKAFIRYHDPQNWPMLREALKKMGRADLIGNGKKHLVPAYQPAVLPKIVQSDGSRFQAKPMPKGFNQTKSFASPKKHTGGRHKH